MKFHIVTTDENGGGSACEALWYELAKEALNGGHQIQALVSAASSSHQEIQALRDGGMQVKLRRRAPRRARLRMMAHQVWQRSGARMELQRALHGQADFVLLNVGTLIEAAREPWFSLLERSEACFGVVVHNNPEIRQYPPVLIERLRRLLQRAARVWFVSQRLWDNAEEQLLIRIPGARVVRNPVNLRSMEIEPWPGSAQPLRMAVVGRLDTYVKGQIRLLHALSGEVWRSRDWQLSIFGAGPDEEKIRKAAAMYGVEDKIIWGGFAKDVRREIWAKHHLLVMPSMLEGMPLTLVEAMICGRPTVCSDVGGAAELVEDGVNGFLAGAPFAGQLGLALERVWERRDELEAMGARAHSDATDFCPANPGKELLADLLTSIE